MSDSKDKTTSSISLGPYDPNSEEMRSLKKMPLWHYIRENKRAFSIGISFLLFTNFLDSIYPAFLARGIDQVVAGEPLKNLLQTAGLFFGIMASLAATRYLWRVYFAEYHTNAAEDLRNKFFAHMTQMGPSYFQRNPIGELISLIANDIQSFRQAIGAGVLILIDGASIVVFILPQMIYFNPTWTWKTLIFLPLVPFLIWFVTRLIFRNYKLQQDRLAELSGISQEIVAGVRVIKNFVQEQVRLNHYNKKSKEFEKACNRVARIDALFGPVMQFGVASGTVTLLFIAANDLIAGVATVGTFVAFQRYITKMVWPMTALGLGLSQYQKGMASFFRIKNHLDQQTDIPDLGTTDVGEFKTLEVRNLTFSFGDSKAPVLTDLSFILNKGETLGVIGPVGSGKSTLLQLLLRLFPVPERSIFVNGVPIEDIRQRSLRKTMALIPQEPFLFSDSIVENIQYGREDVTAEDEIHRWSRVVEMDQEILELPDKYSSQLGERGVNLSGGQKQRLTIARGLILNSPVLLIDDALSAVDTKTERKIEEHLHSDKGGRKTKIVVSHRLQTVMEADHILVLKDGRIEGYGKHHELMTSSPTYKHLAEIQGLRR